MLSNNEWGLLTEKRFLELAQRSTWNTPYWLIRVEQAEPAWDVRGVDAFAHITFNDGELPERVPIQIKSSRKHMGRFVNNHSGLVHAGIVIMVIWPDKTEQMIYHELYESLRKVRVKGRRFEPLLASLESITPSARSLELIEEVQARRRLMQDL